jgi:hypothetical protein
MSAGRLLIQDLFRTKWEWITGYQRLCGRKAKVKFKQSRFSSTGPVTDHWTGSWFPPFCSFALIIICFSANGFGDWPYLLLRSWFQRLVLFAFPLMVSETGSICFSAHGFGDWLYLLLPTRFRRWALFASPLMVSKIGSICFSLHGFGDWLYLLLR